MKDKGAEPYPSKRLGQHFLRDQRTIQRIIDALAPNANETIIEIGPGTGALTSVLVERAGRVIAVEFDNKLTPLLTERFADFPNFNLVVGDALTTDFCAAILPARKARLVANLPYNISTAILQKLILQRECLEEMVLMLQREVVERVLAPAGTTDRGFISVLVEAYCETEKLFDDRSHSICSRVYHRDSVVTIIRHICEGPTRRDGNKKRSHHSRYSGADRVGRSIYHRDSAIDIRHVDEGAIRRDG